MSAKDNLSHISPRLFALLLASMVSMALPVGAQNARTNSSRPALVVGIMVEGLDRQYVEELMEYFGEGGFKRLVNNGVVFSDVDFGTPLTGSAAASMLMTGASPSVTGITTDLVYDYETMRPKQAMFDPAYLGNFTSETFSPVNLRVSTVGDELKIAGAGTSQVFSIAADPNEAIILAGHAANNATWLSDTNANWATSTFYRDTPSVLSRRNRLINLSSRIDTMTWQPSAVTTTLDIIPEWVRLYPFKHTIGKDPQWKVAKFKNTPLFNREATAMAREYISTLGLGRHEGTDMLNIGLSVEPFIYSKYADVQLETADSYIKLDRDLAALFDVIDKEVGLKNAVIYLAGTPQQPLSRKEDPKWALPYGEYSPRKAISLLNLYLMALHGNGEWVNGFYDNYFYLNRNLIKEKELDLGSIQKEAADFLKRMAGVNTAYTIGEILDGHAGVNAHALRRNTSYATAGDVLVDIAPGWEIVELAYSTPYQMNGINMVTRGVSASAPFYLLAPDVAARTIDYRIDARAIAPTIARILRIRSPNGSSLPPVKLK